MYIKAYDTKVDISTIICFGNHLADIAKTFEAIGVDPQKILTVNDEESLEAFKEHYVVFFCNKFDPSWDFIRANGDILFISTDWVHEDSVPDGYPDNFRCIFDIRKVESLSQELRCLSDFTGITAFRGLQYDADADIWVNTGVAIPPKEHTMKDMATRFGQSMIRWIAAGKPTRTKDAITLLFNTFCRQCSNFVINKKDSHNAGSCGICGCRLHRSNVAMTNKLAISTDCCPMTPPKWEANVEYDEAKVKGREAELFTEYLRIQKEYGPQDGTTCGCHD